MDRELAELIARFRQKDRRALARLLTYASRGENIAELRQALDSMESAGRAIALSGNGGVGKSTLIGKLVEAARSRGEEVAVLCCDPQSPVTGGALLGDRVRMAPARQDAGVFIRSLATPGGNQAIAPNLDVMVGLLHAFGFRTVLLETVGAGQGDTAIRDVANVLVVLVQPEAGDDLQWEKAGLLEVADVIVVHKADLPGADRVAVQLREQLNAPGAREVDVVAASASKGIGLGDVWEAIDKLKSAENPPD